MRCSSFEPLLDAYVEGELAPVRRRLVAAHVETCASCEALLRELRVVDALLLVPRRVEPAANFTFKVMADVRALPAPHRHVSTSLPVLGTYLVFGWVAIGAFLLWGGSAPRATLAWLGAFSTRLPADVATLASATGHLFGRTAFDVTALMGGLLASDLVAAAALVVFFAVRGRRAAARRSS